MNVSDGPPRAKQSGSLLQILVVGEKALLESWLSFKHWKGGGVHADSLGDAPHHRIKGTQS